MRKNELITNYMFLLAPILLGVLSAWFTCISFSKPAEALWIMTALFLIGFVMFLKAKISVIKQGKLFTFGPSQMSGLNRISYFAGYGCMVIGLFLFIGIGQ